MSDALDGWKFIAVDPLAPKRRRRKRSPVHLQSAEGSPARQRKKCRNEEVLFLWSHTEALADSIAKLSEPCTTLRAWSASTLDWSFLLDDSEVQHWDGVLASTLLDTSAITDIAGSAIVSTSVSESYSRTPSPSPLIDDFDRFFLLVDQGGIPASSTWSLLFRDDFQIPWTPMASNGIESALFNFYSRETARACVSFEDQGNTFREALVPLAASKPTVFHAALAVAAVHWANRLRLVKAQLGALDEKNEQQLQILKVASSPNTSEQSRQVQEETRAAATVLMAKLGTFVDGRLVREGTLRLVHSVLHRHAHCRQYTPTTLFLRTWQSWIDTLDSTAQRRARITFDDQMSGTGQDLLEAAVLGTVGCSTGKLRMEGRADLVETLRLIARTSRLSTRRLVRNLDEVHKFTLDATELQSDILAMLATPPPASEKQISSHCFNLALYLYYLSSVEQSSLESGIMRWAVKEMLQAARVAAGFRQAWATWPYFMLGVHVTDAADQIFVGQRFRYLETTLSIGNLSALREILDELWRKRAEGVDTDWQE
ncbi:hypothetical protein P7C73_g525, partial [Tremellales sp. Uapishka_1]